MHQCKSTGSKINYVGSSSWKFENWKFITVNIKKLLEFVGGGGGGGAVQLVEAIHHKSGGSVCDSPYGP
jgi:hypothetical protein